MQGGTFLNDAVLRAFENLTGKQAFRPDIAGCMGCYGAALLARDRAGEDGTSTLLSREDIKNLQVKHRSARCGLCSNNCLLTISDFGGGRRFVTGNRCEKGAGHKKSASDAPNLFAYKSQRLFGYEPLAADAAPRRTVGIPRALNMYEDYPFWFTLLHQARLPRRALGPQLQEDLTRRASSRCRPRACATRRSSPRPRR